MRTDAGTGSQGRKRSLARKASAPTEGPVLPSDRIRGNAREREILDLVAYEMFERYVALAREAAAGGGRIADAHAEKLFREMNAAASPTDESSGQIGRHDILTGTKSLDYTESTTLDEAGLEFRCAADALLAVADQALEELRRGREETHKILDRLEARLVLHG
jgi:hypothetical protein